MRLGIVYDDVFLEHGHDDMPESPRRLAAVMAHLRATGWLDELVEVAFEAASPAELAWLHDPEYVEDLALISRTGGGFLHVDTVATERTYEAAVAAAGACMTAARKVLAGQLDQAFCAVRPPGHHAFSSRGTGFCFLNNAALAAEAARRDGAARVAILDWDIHHGNATQEMFYHRGDVLFLSIHQAYRLGGRGLMYPGTGTVDEVGVDAGAGKTINVPLPGGADDADYLEAFEKVFIPALEVHAPDLIVVSAGYDAHHLDPISEMEVTAPGFHRMATLLMEAARTVCDGKVVFVLEGGYDYHALPECVEETLNAVAGRPVAHPDDQARPTRPEYREAVRAYLRHAIETHCARLGL